MQTYEVELRSATDSQSRIISLDAVDESAAAAAAEAKERKIVDFSLLPPARETWENPPNNHKDPDQPSATVDLSRWDAYHPAFAKHAAGLPYVEAVRAADRRLVDLNRRLEVDAKGKVRYANLSPRAVARVLAHRQQEPYAVADVRRVDQAEIDAQRLVREVMAAKANPDPRVWALTVRRLRDAGIPVNAVTASLGGLAWQKQIDGSSVSVFSSAAIQVSLHTAYTFNNDTHDFFDDARGSEITGTGYTANGITAASKASTYDTATDQIRLDIADPSWATSTLSATDAVIWVNTAGADSTDPLWGNIDFGATVTTTAGTFLITIDATGLVVFDVT